MNSPKLIIQIPCFNEEQCLGQVLAALPRSLPGVGQIEFLVIDDGSSDRTVEIARQMQVEHILSLPRHEGLASAYRAGIKHALSLGADLILNTDGDNQYDAAFVASLIGPVLEGRADLVLGTRERSKFPLLPLYKRALYFMASTVVSRLVGQRIPDPVSGFRCVSRKFARRMQIRSRYTYTIETLVEAAAFGYRIETLPVGTHRVTRPSRLIRSVPQYVWNSALAMIGFTLAYRWERWLGDLNAKSRETPALESLSVPSTHP